MTAAMFWTVATVMALLTTAVLVVPLFWFARSPSPEALNKRRIGSALVGALFVPLAALGLYAALGSPESVAQAAASPVLASSVNLPSGHPPTDGMAGNPQAGDLGAAVARLEARLKQSPNDPDGWRLLAQAYAFAGRSEEAAAASARAASPTSAALPSTPANRVPVTPEPPRDADAAKLIATAQDARRKRDFATATQTFAVLAERNALDADLWADYADAHAAQVGQLDETSARFIAQALQREPQHTKALWLLGSYQVKRSDYRAALTTWQTLAAQLAPDSTDHRIIMANIAEARAALATAAPSAAQATAKVVAVRGSVTIDPKLLPGVAADSVLFIYAKAVDSPGPPLAVLRLPVTRGATAFVLDDSSAMLPERKLSQFNKVVVEARISKTGNASPQPGDLKGNTTTLDPRSAGPLKLVINESIS